jgi:2-oxoglutarate dehydrogenase E1 component
MIPRKKQMDFEQEFHGPNAGYILELFDRYRQNPDSVDAQTRAFFERWQPNFVGKAAAVSQVKIEKIVAAANFAQSIRTYGHLAARLDPLGTPPPGDPSLDMAADGLTEEDLRSLPASLVGGPVAERTQNALEAIQELRKVYCSTMGYDYGHIRIPEERDWLREAAECGRYRPPDGRIDTLRLLERLTQIEAFERFLHRIFPGKTRFSIEGLDMMVPVLDETIGHAADNDNCMIFIGMAHRGRLNVLAHIMDKPIPQILAEFKDPKSKFSPWDELGWTGDVKYHGGGSGAVRGENGDGTIKLIICIPPNPSHLEHVNPVVQGMARAAQTQANLPGEPRFHPKAALPILIHGDASFPGQGIVAETLNFSRLPGYRTAGTIHIIANNQLGFTATEGESRSTLYASDLAKGFKIPVIHVNADDPIACIEAARTAFDYHQRFQSDFLIDLVGYRRYGHNEGDEPGFTQPVMYQKIREHPTVRQIWADILVKQGQIEPTLPEELLRREMEKLQKMLESLQPEEALVDLRPELPPPGAARRVETAVPIERLTDLNEALRKVPESFHLNRKLERFLNQRRRAFEKPDEPTIDWALAEELAMASILEEGYPVRLTGEDAVRGTFSQRHASFFDVENEQVYTPLQNIPQAKAAYEVINSPLSENGVIGFEFGYNYQAPERLVIWEAQYGDFINVAQPMIDEFVISARAKWGLTPSLVLLLPHGNEGQGPDHSSGRLERFLTMADEGAVRIAYPTLAAQYFHLLRRQAALLKTDPLPLVVLTPKGLLRHPLVASRAVDLAEGGWQPVIDDAQKVNAPEQVRRLILCSGRIYIDLVTSEHYRAAEDMAIARIEQLHPFPYEEVKSVVERYPHLEQVIWVQEEPRNMGAWEDIRPRLSEILQDRWPLYYVGRPPSSSPAEGSFTWYQANQQSLIEQAYLQKINTVKDGVLIKDGILVKPGVLIEKG